MSGPPNTVDGILSPFKTIVADKKYEFNIYLYFTIKRY